jgi:hypothetical protein
MMLPILYVALLVGAALLAADLLDRLQVEERRLRWWRGIATLATLFVGLQPAIFGIRMPEAVGPPFGLIAGAYVAAAVLYLVGMLVAHGASAMWLRRVGYCVLLLLGALPSMLLLFLTPIIAMAGIGLARPRPVPPIAQTDSRRR